MARKPAKPITDDSETLKSVFELKVNFKQRVILLNQDITDDSFDLIELALTELERLSDEPVTLRISSYGGDECAGLAIVGRIRSSKVKIVTEGYGKIMSAATLILAAGHERRMSRFASFMHHESSYSETERHQNMRAIVKYREEQEHKWAEWMAEFSQMPKKFYYDQGKSTDKYWDAEQCLAYGIIDKII